MIFGESRRTFFRIGREALESQLTEAALAASPALTFSFGLKSRSRNSISIERRAFHHFH
jgi:hypothetical protein